MCKPLTVLATGMVALCASWGPAHADEAVSHGGASLWDAAALQHPRAMLPLPEGPSPGASDADAHLGEMVPMVTHSIAGAPFKLGPPPAPPANTLMNFVPRLGAFELTFYSDHSADGFDAMANADVVIYLTYRF